MLRTKKMLKTATAALVGLSVVGCSDSKVTTDEISPDLNPNRAGGCREWNWDDKEGVYVCDERNHSNLGYYYFAGRLFQNAKLLHRDSKYKSYKSIYRAGTSSVPNRLSPSSGVGTTTTKNNNNSTSSKSSSGFGKGFFGGTGG